MKSFVPFALGAAILAIPAAAAAHFVLVEPAATLEQNKLGDPQKLAPCGGTSANAGTPTNIVTPVVGGSMLHIKVQETVYHPGHYRIALAVNDMSELPPDPVTTTRETPRGPWSVSAKIERNPKPPILADGLFEHNSRPAPGSFFETDIKVPNIDCETCVLQVVQWMADHGLNKDGEYSYHHCAAVKITANKKLPRDKGWPKQK